MVNQLSFATAVQSIVPLPSFETLNVVIPAVEGTSWNAGDTERKGTTSGIAVTSTITVFSSGSSDSMVISPV